MLVSARDLVLRLPQADERLIRVGLSGNLCRCTGYVGIVRAVQSVIEARRARDIAPMPDGGRKILGPVGSGRSAQRRDRAERMRPAASEPMSPEAAGSVASIPDFIPATVLEQQFTVAHPPEQVFAMFDDIAAVAACLPGASLTAPPKPERVEGADPGQDRSDLGDFPRGRAGRAQSRRYVRPHRRHRQRPAQPIFDTRRNSLSAGADRCRYGNARRTFDRVQR